MEEKVSTHKISSYYSYYTDLFSNSWFAILDDNIVQVKIERVSIGRLLSKRVPITRYKRADKQGSFLCTNMVVYPSINDARYSMNKIHAGFAEFNNLRADSRYQPVVDMIDKMYPTVHVFKSDFSHEYSGYRYDTEKHTVVKEPIHFVVYIDKNGFHAEPDMTDDVYLSEKGAYDSVQREVILFND